MTDLSQKLLERALDNILFGCTRYVTDYNGNVTEQTVGDLRNPFVQELAKEIIKSTELKDKIISLLSDELLTVITTRLANSISFSELHYNIRNDLQDKVSEKTK